MIILVLLQLLCLSFATSLQLSSRPRLSFLPTIPKIAVQNMTTTSPTNKPIWQQNLAIRRLYFWSHAAKIYTSYKSFQVYDVIQRRRGGQEYNSTSAWHDLHENNACKMMDLCLQLRGFYLKTGQFLATRYDFMPIEYIRKLSQLHDDVPSMPAEMAKQALQREVAPKQVDDYLTNIDYDEPLGSASIAQVHQGIWHATGKKVAIKLQNNDAEYLMRSDLNNLLVLAKFLQRTELKFDILSAIQELRKQIHHEFDFRYEGKNMAMVKAALQSRQVKVEIPDAIFVSKRLLVMSFIDGINLSQLAKLQRNQALFIPDFVKQRFGRGLLERLAKIWAEQIFVLHIFHADPHPGNICLLPASSSSDTTTKTKRDRKQSEKKMLMKLLLGGGKYEIGLLDWGQVKVLSSDVLLKFSTLILALHHRQREGIVDAFLQLQIKVQHPNDHESIEGIAINMFDSRDCPNFTIDPFSPNSAIKRNAVLSMPSDLYFLLRTIQILRGMSKAFGLKDFSLADNWSSYAQQVVNNAK